MKTRIPLWVVFWLLVVNYLVFIGTLIIPLVNSFTLRFNDPFYKTSVYHWIVILFPYLLFSTALFGIVLIVLSLISKVRGWLKTFLLLAACSSIASISFHTINTIMWPAFNYNRTGTLFLTTLILASAVVAFLTGMVGSLISVRRQSTHIDETSEVVTIPSLVRVLFWLLLLDDISFFLIMELSTYYQRIWEANGTPPLLGPVTIGLVIGLPLLGIALMISTFAAKVRGTVKKFLILTGVIPVVIPLCFGFILIQYVSDSYIPIFLWVMVLLWLLVIAFFAGVIGTLENWPSGYINVEKEIERGRY